MYLGDKDSANREIYKKMLAYFCISEVQPNFAKQSVQT